MPAARLTMRKIREVFRLKFEARLSNRKIAKSCSLARSTVGEYIRRFNQSQLNWPLPKGFDDTQLEQLLFPQQPTGTVDKRPLPDWSHIHRELKRKGVTLNLLWQEYKSVHPHGYQYSQFFYLYRQWTGHIDPVMRQEHKAGEKLFVDYAGMTVTIYDSQRKKTREAQVFVATLGASNYTYAEATWTQSLPDWIGSHTRAFDFFGGVTEVVVPDNLKSGVKTPCYYEPDINPTYLAMANHYGTVVIPARVQKPKDKAKVETAVQIVERWILARLRNRQFFSLHELNRAIRVLLIELNSKDFQKLPGSRKQLFDTLDRPALKALPLEPYQYAEWKKARVNIDYHIEVERHYYSVPHPLIKKQLDVRITVNTIECFYKNKRVASHVRNYLRGHHSTVKEHMPKSHRKWAEWSPQRFVRWAEKIGPRTTELIESILSSRKHPQQGYRSCLGILRLVKSYGEDRLENACWRAIAIGATSYKSVASILKCGLDQKPLTKKIPDQTIDHDNIRDADYYQ